MANKKEIILISAPKSGAEILEKVLKNVAKVTCKLPTEAEINNEVTYVYLYRDVRNVTLAERIAKTGNMHPYVIATEWVKQQDAAFNLKEKVAKFVAVKYEDLVTNATEALAKICSTAEIELSEKDIKQIPTEGEEELKAFVRKMTMADITIVETMACVTMQVLGYDVFTPLDKLFDGFAPDIVTAFKMENKVLMSKYAK